MTRRLPVRAELLGDRLDALAATFDVSTISPDPLELLLRYDDPRDQEVAGLIAAAFAYGRADIIVANIGRMLKRMTSSPFRYLAAFDRAEASRRFAGFVHRFHKTRELVDAMACIASAIDTHGSVGELFRASYRDQDDDIGPKLVMPVDTHIHRITTFLGLNRRKSVDWKTARRLTDRLTRFDSSDPVRYDFALCRLGILDLCSRVRRKENCDVCLLRDVCRVRVS